ncbi:putative lipid II flippase FtsW [Deltaproteobacteria bacterium TL4]
MKRSDPILIIVTIILLLWGTVMVYSTSAIYATQRYGNSNYFILKHMMHIAIALGGFCLAWFVDYRKWKKLIPILMLGSLLLLILVYIPGIGHEVKGGRRWIRFIGLGFQPAELLKVILILYVASYLERKQELLSSFFRGISPNFIVTGIYLALVLLQPDFGTVVLLSLTILLMIYAGGAKTSHILGSLTGVSLIAAIMIASYDYRVKRLSSFLNPWDDPLDSGYQIIQSIIALGSGGVWGRGLGESRQKLFFLPDAHTDFIFAILGEEFGFIGIFLLMLLFAIYLWRGYVISWNSGDNFGKYLAFGTTTLIGLQVIFNLGVVTALLPTKGLPLPFISFGGSSILTTLFITGLLLNIQRGQFAEAQHPKGMRMGHKLPGFL